MSVLLGVVRRAILVPLVAALALPPAVRGGDTAESRLFERAYVSLFTIERSLNGNRVVYEARLTPEGFAPEPVRIHWAMEDGTEEALTAFERGSVYGIEVDKFSHDEVVFTLKAMKGRPITLRRRAGVTATLVLGGEDRVLEKIFIQLRRGGLFPRVEYLDVTARDAEGNAVVERIVP